MSSRSNRDLGLERIGRGTRYLAVGAFLGGGILTAAVAKALPGHSHRPSNSGSVSQPANPPAAPGAGFSSGPQSSSRSGLSAPAQAPQPSYSAPVVSSGGS